MIWGPEARLDYVIGFVLIKRNCSNAFSLQNEFKTVRYVPPMTIMPIVFVPEHTGYKLEQLYLFRSYKIKSIHCTLQYCIHNSGKNKNSFIFISYTE